MDGINSVYELLLDVGRIILILVLISFVGNIIQSIRRAESKVQSVC